MNKDLNELIKDFCKKYSVPEMALDDLLIKIHEPALKKLIDGLRQGVISILDELEDELEGE